MLLESFQENHSETPIITQRSFNQTSVHLVNRLELFHAGAELKETEAEELQENNQGELQEGMPMQEYKMTLKSENQTGQGQAEKTGAKELNVSEPEEPYKETLEVTEKEELILDVSDEPKTGAPKQDESENEKKGNSG